MGFRGDKTFLVFWVVFLGFYVNTKEKNIRPRSRKSRPGPEVGFSVKLAFFLRGNAAFFGSKKSHCSAISHYIFNDCRPSAALKPSLFFCSAKSPKMALSGPKKFLSAVKTPI